MLVVDDLKTHSGMVSHYMYISHCIVRNSWAVA